MPRHRAATRIYTDDEIAAMPHVPPEIAGPYIGKSAQYVRVCLQAKCFPVGIAHYNRRWAYHIPGPALVRYKQYGAPVNYQPTISE